MRGTLKIWRTATNDDLSVLSDRKVVRGSVSTEVQSRDCTVQRGLQESLIKFESAGVLPVQKRGEQRRA